MLSKWYVLKETAIEKRRKGYSIRDIEKTLGIPRSTLSGWFKEIKLSEKQLLALNNKRLSALVLARKAAVNWHNKKKQENPELARCLANTTLQNIDLTNLAVLELALSILYLGEGSKTKQTSLGNSNPTIIKFFTYSLNKLYKLDPHYFYYELHLRADQNSKKVARYWSENLNVPEKKFKVFFDKRTVKSKTFDYYMGVCVVRCGNVAIQRKLMYLSLGYLKKIASKSRSVSSVG